MFPVTQDDGFDRIHAHKCQCVARNSYESHSAFNPVIGTSSGPATGKSSSVCHERLGPSHLADVESGPELNEDGQGPIRPGVLTGKRKRSRSDDDGRQVKASKQSLSLRNRRLSTSCITREQMVHDSQSQTDRHVDLSRCPCRIPAGTYLARLRSIHWLISDCRVGQGTCRKGLLDLPTAVSGDVAPDIGSRGSEKGTPAHLGNNRPSEVM